MSMEYLKQIREIEEQAEKLRRDALAESKRVVNMATDEAAALVERVQIEAESSYKKTLNVANDEATDDYNNILNQAQWEHSMLLKTAEENMDKAVEVIVRKVKN